MPGQQLLLCWKDHNSALVSVFENLLKKNALVDCTLAAEGQYLKAHKVVLSACSSYFELLFSQESEKNPIVILKDVKFEDLEAAVNFMYRGEVEVCKERLAAFLEVADSLQIKGLESDGKSQDSKQNDSSAKSVLTQKHRKKDSNPQCDDSGQSLNVPADCEHTRNDESSSDDQSSRREISPILTVSSFSMGSSSYIVGKETIRDSESRENIGQSLALPSFNSGESIPSQENTIIKAEPVTFLEDQSDEAEQDFGDDVTMVGDQDCYSESSNDAMNVVLTNQQDIGYQSEHIKTEDSTSENVEGMLSCNRPLEGTVWVQSDDQQTFSSIFLKEEPDTSASLNQEAVAFDDTECGNTAESSAERSATSAGVDNLVIEDNDHLRPASVQFCVHVAGNIRSSVSVKSANKSLQQTTPRPLSKKFPCPCCEEVFVRKIDLQRHKRSWCCSAVRREKPFKCPHCYYSCEQKGILVQHIRTHTGEKPFKCPLCGFAFSQKSSMVQHLKRHTREKRFKCPHCYYTCERKGSLVEHLKTHPWGKLFKCPRCDYGSSVKSNLLMHLRTHTGEKPFKCPHCNYKSSQKSNLVHHVRIHTGEKPFKCPHCDYAARQKNSLLLHVRTHTRKEAL